VKLVEKSLKRGNNTLGTLSFELAEHVKQFVRKITAKAVKNARTPAIARAGYNHRAVVAVKTHR